MKRYNDLDSYLKKTFGTKVIKLSLDGGFSSPNKEKNSGCVFYSDSGYYAASRDPDTGLQIQQQITLLSKKWPEGIYIAYFGSNSSTYSDPECLREIYDEQGLYLESISIGRFGLPIKEGSCR